MKIDKPSQTTESNDLCLNGIETIEIAPNAHGTDK